MPGLRRYRQRAPISRVQHEVIDDVAEKMRAFDLEIPARAIEIGR